jgi:hypothetical protein
VRVKLLDNEDNLLWFIPDVENLSPEEIHIELSTAIDKQRELEKDQRENASYGN